MKRTSLRAVLLTAGTIVVSLGASSLAWAQVNADVDTNVQTPRPNANVDANVQTPAPKANIDANVQTPKAGADVDLNAADRAPTPRPRTDVNADVDATTSPPRNDATLPRSSTRQAAPGNLDASDNVRARTDTNLRSVDFGFQFAPDTTNGLSISDIEANSAAARAGLRSGDQILTVDGRRFSSSAELNAYLRQNAGSRVPFVYTRDGRESTIYFDASSALTSRDSLPRAGAQAATGFRDVDLGWQLGDRVDNGWKVTTVQRDSMAWKSGLRDGDVIVMIDGRRFEKPDEINTYIHNYPGERITYTFIRDGEEHTGYWTAGTQVAGRPAEETRFYPDQQGNSPQRAALGVELVDNNGIYLHNVVANSPAARAGLQTGDYILNVNGNRQCFVDNFISSMQQMNPGDSISLGVCRNGQMFTMNVTLDRWEAAFQGESAPR